MIWFGMRLKSMKNNQYMNKQMVSTQMLYVIIAVLALAVVGLAIPLGIFMQKCSESDEGLCLCRTGGLVMQSVDRQKKIQQYNDGLTEYSVLQPPNWRTEAVNPPYM